MIKSTQSKYEHYYRLCPSVRLAIFILTLVGTASLNGSYAAFNFALVCMVNETTSPSSSGWTSANSSNVSDDGYPSHQSTGSRQKSGYDGEFDWDKSTLAYLIAAYGIGGFASNIPSGLLADRYGSKMIFAACVAINVITNGLTPTAAYRGVTWLFFLIVMQGFACGASWPAILAMVPRWGTPSESGTLLTVGASGYQLGPLIAMFTSSFMCSSEYRWPLIFYVWSTVCAIYLVIWLFVYNDDPSQSRFISEHELVYIQHNNMRKGSTQESFWRLPWKSLLFAPCAIAIYVSHFCWGWTVYYVTAFMPTYSKEVLQLDVTSNGLTSALPFLCMCAMRLVFGPISDRLTFCGRSKTFSVKFFTFLCMMIPSLCFVLLGFLDRRHTALAIVTIGVACGFMGTSTSGYLRGGVLMASRYSGVVASLANTTCSVAAAFMPHVIGAVVRKGTVDEWQYTAFLTGAVMFLGFVGYTIFGTAEDQKWSVADNHGRWWKRQQSIRF